MNTIINKMGKRKHLGMIVAFALIVVMLFSVMAPMVNSVYAAGDKVTINFYDYEIGADHGKLLKTQEVDRGKIADPPKNPSQKGLTFLGWDTSYVAPTDPNIHEVNVCAVYEVKITTEAEEEGELAAASTAEPPAELVIVQPTGEAITVTASESAIDPNEVIPPTPSPLTKPMLSPMTIFLIVLAAILAVVLVGYIVYITKRRKSQTVA